MRSSLGLLTFLLGTLGGVLIGRTDPQLGMAWGGIFGAVLGGFAAKALFR